VWPFMATVRSLMAFILNLIRKLKSGQWLGTGLMVTIVAVLARARILSSLLLGAAASVSGSCGLTPPPVPASGPYNRDVPFLVAMPDAHAFTR
jgi:hypothetical protein